MEKTKYKQSRRFDKESYDKYDDLPKKLVSDFLIGRGHTIISSVEDYNHDLITERNGKRFYFELEVKVGYPFTSAADYKFDTVSFLGRKIRLHNLNSFYYLIMSYETRCIAYCDSTIIFNEEYSQEVSVNGNNRSGIDKLYRVPKNLCGFFFV